MKIIKIIFIVFWASVGIRALAMYPNFGVSGSESLGALMTLSVIFGLPIYFVVRSLMNDQTDFEEE